jgi:hypothetical protein
LQEQIVIFIDTQPTIFAFLMIGMYHTHRTP